MYRKQDNNKMFTRAAVMFESNKRMDPESTALIGQLQSQIDDLTLFLEEERINHKDTKRKAADLLRDQIESLQHQHANTVKSMEEKHTEEVEEIRADYDKLIFENQKYFDTNTAKMRGEIEFLQGAFESYKTQLLQEMEVKWSKKTSELETNYKTEMDKKLHELKSRMTMERSHENAKASKDHQQEVAGLKREHKKEVDALMRRFANHAADQKKLEETQTRLDEVESEYKTVKEDYDRVCRQVTTMASELTDTKLRLLDFEKNFDEKIEEIDDKYKAQMHELMTQNAEIRRQYVKKCDELFTAKALAETNRREKIGSAKDAMKRYIQQLKMQQQQQPLPQQLQLQQQPQDQQIQCHHHQYTNQPMPNQAPLIQVPSMYPSPTYQSPNQALKPFDEARMQELDQTVLNNLWTNIQTNVYGKKVLEEVEPPSSDSVTIPHTSPTAGLNSSLKPGTTSSRSTTPRPGSAKGIKRSS